MRGKSEYPPLHAGQHAPDGSDPLTGFIRYDFENVGAYLHVTATGPSPFGSVLSLYSQGDLSFGSESSMVFDSTNGAGGNMALVGNGVTITSQDGEAMVLTADGVGASITIKSNDDGVQIHIGGVGSQFSVFDSSGNPKLQWTDGTTALHIPTGGTIVADL